MSDKKRESAGEFETERDLDGYGYEKGFRFRMPYSMESFEVMRQRDLLLGMPADKASDVTAMIAMAQAVYNVLCIKKPSGFDLAKELEWTDMIAMSNEVLQWQEQFRQHLARQKAGASPEASA